MPEAQLTAMTKSEVPKASFMARPPKRHERRDDQESPAHAEEPRQEPPTPEPGEDLSAKQRSDVHRRIVRRLLARQHHGRHHQHEAPEEQQQHRRRDEPRQLEPR